MHQFIKGLSDNNDLRTIIDVSCVYFIKITLHAIIEIGISAGRPILHNL